MKLVGIYAIRNLRDGRRYIGSSTDIQSRFRAHRSLLRREKHHNPWVQRAWNNHGAENFSFEILHVGLEDHELPEAETRAIEEYRQTFGVYNMAPVGGSLRGFKFGPQSAEHRAKIGVALKGKKKNITPEGLIKIRQAHAGKTITPEHKAAVARAARDRAHTPETREKLRISATNPSPETRQRRSLSMKKAITSERRAQMSRNARKISDETRRRRSEAVKASWVLRKATQGRSTACPNPQSNREFTAAVRA